MSTNITKKMQTHFYFNCQKTKFSEREPNYSILLRFEIEESDLGTSNQPGIGFDTISVWYLKEKIFELTTF